MRLLILACMLAAPAIARADAGTCPPDRNDRCFQEQSEVCRWQENRNPPPWSTPESRAKKLEDAKKKLEACRKLPPPPPPPKKGPGHLPPWRKP